MLTLRGVWEPLWALNCNFGALTARRVSCISVPDCGQPKSSTLDSALQVHFSKVNLKFTWLIFSSYRSTLRNYYKPGSYNNSRMRSPLLLFSIKLKLWKRWIEGWILQPLWNAYEMSHNETVGVTVNFTSDKGGRRNFGIKLNIFCQVISGKVLFFMLKIMCLFSSLLDLLDMLTSSLLNMRKMKCWS